MSSTDEPNKGKMKLLDYVNPLQCPTCKNEYCYLHHEIINVYQRTEETGTKIKTTLITITTEDNSIAIFPECEKNLSQNRGSIEIIFRCEFCARDYALHIIQHEGATCFGWAIDGSPEYFLRKDT